MSTLDSQNMNRPKGDKQKFCMKDWENASNPLTARHTLMPTQYKALQFSPRD